MVISCNQCVYSESSLFTEERALSKRYFSLVFFRTMSRININSRGRAYKCQECGHVGERRRVISHFYKDHVRLDESPFYCTLCLFRSTEEDALLKHVRNDVYPLHNQRLTSLKKKGAIIDENKILMKSLNPRLLVEGQDYQRLSQEASDGEWQRRRKPTALLARPSETENILDSLLDYNPDERFSPLPAALPPLVLPPAPTRMFNGPQATMVYSPYQQAEVRQNQQAQYIPTPISSLASVLSTASSLQEIPGYLASSQVPFYSSPSATLTASTYQVTPPCQVTTVYAPHSSISSVPVAKVAPPRIVPSEMPTQSTITADVLMTPTTLPRQLASSPFSPAMPVDFTSPLLTVPVVPSSAPVETKSVGIMTDKISLPDGNEQLSDNSPLGSSINERDRDSGVAKAILEMSRNLVSALEKTTFQIEMTRNTLSAFLRRLDDRDRERDVYPGNYNRPRQLFKRRSSSPPPTSEPEKKKKKTVSSSVVVPSKKH